MDEYRLAEQVVPRSTSDNTVALVELVTELGPDISEIARRLGQYKESVRYRYKEKLLKRGFAVKADVDYGALGLKRVVMKLRFSQAYAGQSHEIFKALGELAFLVAFAGTLPGDTYIAHAGVPTELVAEHRSFMESLREEGILSSVEFFDCDWFRVAPMKAQCFDFDEGVWDFDWSNPPRADERAARATISEKKCFDKIDLLLVKELWKDSDRSLKEIQSSIEKVNGIEVNYKTLGWHYAHHVLGRRLVRDYSITWHGMKYNSDLQAIERSGKHSFLGISLIVRDTTEQEKMTLSSQLNRLPFQWSEASGSAYYTQLFFPLDTVNEALEYLKTLLRPYGRRAEVFVLDRREMTSYTIGYELWDDDSSAWKFDPSVVLPRLERSLLSVRKATRA